jgi:exodeoxyribonuclease VII small subunit
MAETNVERTGGEMPDKGESSGEASLSFEAAMDQLEAIVAKLESGDVPLEQAIELFQEGMRLSRLCGSKLEQVERKIEMLIETEQGLQRKPFAPEE